MAGVTSLTLVPNVYEAEMVCALLRTEGIKCEHRPTNLGDGMKYLIVIMHLAG